MASSIITATACVETTTRPNRKKLIVTVFYREYIATSDFECYFCKELIRKGEKYLRYSATARRSATGHWESYRAHGRYPIDCPDSGEEKTA